MSQAGDRGERISRAYWLGKVLLAVATVSAPLVAYTFGSSLVEGRAQKEYFEAVAQLLPILLLALAVEQRYFNREQKFPEAPPSLRGRDGVVKGAFEWAAKVYALIVLALLAVGEVTALQVLGGGESSHADLSRTAGSLATGFTALIISILIGAHTQTRGSANDAG